MDSITATTTGPQTQPLPTRPPAPASVDSLPIQFLKSLVDDPAKQHQNGSVSLDNQALAFLVKLLEDKAKQKRQLQLIIEDLCKLRACVTTIEAGQMTCPAPQTIIHARVGTTPLKEVDVNIVVNKANKFLKTMNATVQGEQVMVKAVRVLPLGDVSFYSHNRQHKDWLNKHKHEWSKQVHPDLESTPSTYSVLAHGIPRNFNVDATASKFVLASDNGFVAENIFKIRWLGGPRDPSDTRQAGTIVIALSDATLANQLVKQRGIFLNGSFH
ncbi:hypothetical protein PCANC_11565 [Puccinia coronata f. sp. avenae]|uniref:Uncharacterized protein n=1 Tax=Puccinia coronata f. sp. avenae TaxID=200324 RepID=A0A2N5V819_9BASI|nr:hypothetical protein PCANC_11565 [Puccinia coronata f. sp. avenae]